MVSIKVSEMSGKMEYIPAINTNPLTNQFCNKMRQVEGSICKRCYSCNMLKTFRQTCVKPFEINGQILSTKGLKEAECPKINTVYFRYSAHGELINDIHFLNYCMIAKVNSKTTFALWTKRKDIVKKHQDKIPANLILIWSNPKIDSIARKPPVGFHKVFNVVENNTTAIVNCGAKKCFDCGLCYTKNNGVDCIVEHMKAKNVSRKTPSK